MKINYRIRPSLVGCKVKINYDHPEIETWIMEEHEEDVREFQESWPIEEIIPITAVPDNWAELNDGDGNFPIKFLTIVEEAQIPKVKKIIKKCR